MGTGVFRQRNGMVAVDVVAACGVLTPGQLSGLSRKLEELEAFRVKLTSRQTMVVVLAEEKAQALIEALPALDLVLSPYGDVIRAVKACAGNAALCPRSTGEALDLGIELQKKYLGRQAPKDFKIAVAGCYRGCVDPHCADFGVVAVGKDVFDVIIGGYGGSAKPLHGKLIARKVTTGAVYAVLDHVLERFSALAQPGEKLGRAISRLGLGAFMPPDELVNCSVETDNNEFKKFLLSGQ
ncbi:MAG: nitrite reductase [Peptococcaceae bacterium BRH_c4b]|nr:MAG: nitrite reductase [Peptococcaceae bacterium BRH_c4b]